MCALTAVCKMERGPDVNSYSSTWAISYSLFRAIRNREESRRWGNVVKGKIRRIRQLKEPETMVEHTGREQFWPRATHRVVM